MIKTTKILMAVTAIFFTAIAITSSIFIEQAKYTTIGFYNVPADVEEALKPIIQKDSTMIQFKDLTESEYLSEKLNKRVQMIIAYNDATTQNLSKKAHNLPKSVKDRYPISIKKSKYFNNRNTMVIQPILLDQFETIVFQNILKRNEVQFPEHFSQLENYANAAKWYYPIPITLSGAEDINVNSFITMIINIYGGKPAYDDMILQLQEIAKTTDDFSEFLDCTLKNTDMTMRNILDLLKDWQNNNLLDAQWYLRSPFNTAKFIDNEITTMLFMNMSEHRTKPNPNIRYYTQMQIPAETSESLISVQPAIVALTFKNNEKTKEIQHRLSATQTQESLSNKTKLAPSILAGEAYDSLSTNARYLAASTSGGPVADIGTMALQTTKERHLLAEAIRNYLQ